MLETFNISKKEYEEIFEFAKASLNKTASHENHLSINSRVMLTQLTFLILLFLQTIQDILVEEVIFFVPHFTVITTLKKTDSL